MFDKIFNFLFEKKKVEKKQTQIIGFSSIKKRGDFLQDFSIDTNKQSITCLSAYFNGVKGLKKAS